MKLMFSICAITLSLLSSAVQANPESNAAHPLAIEGPLGKVGPSEPLPGVRIYDIWCNPKGDDCYFTTNTGGRKLSRARLRAHIPMADDTSNCVLEFCYNEQQSVIGLNPAYPLWAKTK